MASPSPLPAAWDVPQVFRDRIGRGPGRQRVMSTDGNLLLVLHAPPAENEIARRGRYFWRSPEGQWLSNELGGGTAALERHLGEYADLIESYDRLEQQAEVAEEYFRVLNYLAPIHRAARHLHHVLQEARKADPDDRDLIDLRDRAYEIERSADLLYGEAKNSLDYQIARRAEEEALSSYRMAASAHRLNLLAAFFFPIATLTAIFGVNLRHGLEDAPPPAAIASVVAIGLLLGAALTWFVARTSPNPPRRGRSGERPR